MFKRIIPFFLVLGSLPLQAIHLDSLLQVVATTTSDSQRMAAHTELGFDYWWEQKDHAQAMVHFTAAIREADQLKIGLAQGQNRRYHGMVLADLARYEEALTQYEASHHFLRTAEPVEWLKLLVDIGNAYYYQADFPSAVIAYQKADSLALTLPNNPHTRSVIVGNLGALFMELELPYKAKTYHQEAVRLAAAMGDQNRLGVSLHNLGGAYEVLDSLEEAIEYFRQALTIAKAEDNLRLQGFCHNSLASVYHTQGRLRDAISQAKLAFPLAETKEDEMMIGSRLLYYKGKERLSPEIETRMNQLLAEIQELDLPIHAIELQEFMEEVYALNGNFPKAYELNQQRQRLQDSIQGQEIQENIQRLELKYQTEQKEKENLKLKAENEAQAAAIRQRNLILLFSGLLVLSGSWLFYFYQKTLQNRKELAEQEAKLHQQRILEMEQLQQLLSMRAMVSGQEAERSRLAKELHDGMGGLLSTVRLQLSQLKEEDELLQTHQGFHQANELLDKASQELRQVAHNLMPQTLLKFGLEVALEDF
ncbi:MAG: tetratricopeptide repeat protein, partial [Bacteroidota bacterium]